ncbi:MAG TPA: hypothetical protein VIY48_21215, partial [Candidatus Paceibacterota bacterium]
KIAYVSRLAGNLLHIARLFEVWDKRDIDTNITSDREKLVRAVERLDHIRELVEHAVRKEDTDG